jgi:hypothetical protein
MRVITTITTIIIDAFLCAKVSLQDALPRKRSAEEKLCVPPFLKILLHTPSKCVKIFKILP